MVVFWSYMICSLTIIHFLTEFSNISTVYLWPIFFIYFIFFWPQKIDSFLLFKIPFGSWTKPPKFEALTNQSEVRAYMKIFGRYSLPMAGGWDEMVFKTRSNTNHYCGSMTVWNIQDLINDCSGSVLRYWDSFSSGLKFEREEH